MNLKSVTLYILLKYYFPLTSLYFLEGVFPEELDWEDSYPLSGSDARAFMKVSSAKSMTTEAEIELGI